MSTPHNFQQLMSSRMAKVCYKYHTMFEKGKEPIQKKKGYFTRKKKKKNQNTRHVRE